jgi:exonuclease 1
VGIYRYIIYFIDRVHALLEHGVTPFVVFDGGPLPMKKGTEEERRKYVPGVSSIRRSMAYSCASLCRSRAKNRELGLQCLRQKKYTEARRHFVRAADVTPYMAHRVICQLRVLNVQYVVAPYEADAQLAFLVKSGIVNGVITEDSDCLPFGCEKVLFKMDREGVAQEVNAENLKHNDGLSFHMFTHEMVQDAAAAYYGASHTDVSPSCSF